MSARWVAAFNGEVRCTRESGAVQWRLSGVDRDGGGALEILLAGVAALELPAQLMNAELHADGDPSDPSWELRSGGGAWRLAARSVQVHRGVRAAFERALPAVKAPWSVRAGWALLLDALRVPGVARLLRSLRGGNRAAEAEHHG